MQDGMSVLSDFLFHRNIFYALIADYKQWFLCYFAFSASACFSLIFKVVHDCITHIGNKWQLYLSFCLLLDKGNTILIPINILKFNICDV